jgi:hypothetical protein
MVFLERAITSFLLTGSDNFVKLFYSVDEAALNTIPLPMTHRQLGKSYLGVLNCDSGSVSLLDTPFSDLSNVVSIRMTEAARALYFSFCFMHVLWCVNFSVCWWL